MKKYFLLLFCLLLTGCSVNYNLELDENDFKEVITGDIKNSEYEDFDSTDINTYNYLLNSKQSPFINSNNYFYEQSITKNKITTDFKYTYTYDENNFKDHRILNTCFESFSFDNNDDNYFIMVSGKYTCPIDDKIEVNIKTENKVISNNANKINKNTYTYIINDENKDDIDFYISLSKDKKTKSKNIGKIIFSSVLIFFTVLIILISNKISKRYD